MTVADPRRAIEAIYRIESARLIAALARNGRERQLLLDGAFRADAALELERADHRGELLGLRRQLGGRGGRLLGAGRIVVRDLIHL